MRRISCIRWAAVWALSVCLLGGGWTAQAAEEDFIGRFLIAESLPPGGGSPYNGTVDVNPKRSAVYAVNWRLDNGKRLRGLALRDGDDLLGVSLNTGGAAYGLAMYRRDADGKRWHGPWISSIDSGAILGEIGFDAGDGLGLPGRHTFTGRRGRMGAFSGTVNIAQRGEGFLLTFTTSGGVALYRGIGVLCGDDRLAVAWSFGGTPSVAVYRPNQKHGMEGRRLSLPRSRDEALAGTERLTREGYLDDTIFPPLLPTPANNAAAPSKPDPASSPVPVSGANIPSAVKVLPPAKQTKRQ